MIWLLPALFGCPHPAPPVSIAPAQEVTVQFAVERGEQVFAGLAVVSHDADRVRLLALGPVGVELFRVDATPDGLDLHAPEAWAPKPGLRPWSDFRGFAICR
ncbi:MAG: DUF3261 domain-containing protein [Deltaproteobacteria bacterium]|nr:DUF3261 domain-containing protein [Deltaproteobacteria bacterium]